MGGRRTLAVPELPLPLPQLPSPRPDPPSHLLPSGGSPDRDPAWTLLRQTDPAVQADPGSAIFLTRTDPKLVRLNSILIKELFKSFPVLHFVRN